MSRLVVAMLLCCLLGCNGSQDKPLPPDEYYPAANLAVVQPGPQSVPAERLLTQPAPGATLPSYFTKPEGKDGLFTEEQLQLQEQYTKQQIEVKRRLQQLDGESEPPLRSHNPYFQTPSPMFPQAKTMQPTSPPKLK